MGASETIRSLFTNSHDFPSFPLFFFLFILRWPGAIIITDHFYRALGSVLKQAHCTHVTCDSEGMTVAKCIFLISTEVVYWQCYLVVTWLVPHETTAILAHVLCTPYNPAVVYMVTLFEAMYVRCICVFSYILPSALLAE